jgi:riboflavin kinase/FMN adenylyltransferase
VAAAVSGEGRISHRERNRNKPEQECTVAITVVNGVTNVSTGGRPVVLTLGFFDGVHQGHRLLIESLVSTARAMNAKPVVLTFDSHPFRVVCPHKLPPIIMTLTERIEILEELGVECVIVQPFDREFAEISADDFIADILVKKLRAKVIVGGYDCHFGKNRAGNHEMLRAQADKYGYRFFDVPPYEIDGAIVSSTSIRTAIAEGDLDTALHYLGRPWTIWSHIVEGHGIGRTMGYPTANLEVGYLVMPKAGVYASSVIVNGKSYRALMYVGTRSTFSHHSEKVVCEVYLMDFSGDLYQEWIRVQPLGFIREDQRFGSQEELQKQITEDVSTANALWNKTYDT